MAWQVRTCDAACQVLFVFKGIGWIHGRGSERMDAGDNQGNQDGDQCRECKEVPLYLDVFTEILQPAADSQIREGPA